MKAHIHDNHLAFPPLTVSAAQKLLAFAKSVMQTSMATARTTLACLGRYLVIQPSGKSRCGVVLASR